MKSSEILDSWKDIARYLERDIKTCYRWEKELGLPIHRIDDTSSRSNVFAYKSEIDQWLQDRAKNRDVNETTLPQKRRLPLGALLGAAGLIGILLVVYVIWGRFLYSPTPPPLGGIEYPSVFDEIKSLGSVDAERQSEEERALQRLAEDNVDPWELYSQGNYFLEKNTQEANELAAALFLKVIRSEEEFPLAHMGLAQCYLNNVRNLWLPRVEWLDMAEDLVRRARSAARDLPEYYSVIVQIKLLRDSFFDQGTFADAVARAEEAIRKFPNHPRLNYLLGSCYFQRFSRSGDEADLERALDFMKKSYWLNPYALHNLDYAEILMLRLDFAGALEVCDQLKHFDSSGRVRFRMGEIYYFAGDLEVSRLVFEEIRTPLQLRFYSALYLAMISSRKADKDKAQSLLREVEAFFPEGPVLRQRALMQASAYFGLGRDKEGYRHLSALVEDPQYQRNKHLILIYIALDPNFDTPRDKARFNSLLASR
jgi:tetratricopeptide (TPR) repeat protein